MREIKFRAWDTNSKKMFDCSKIQDYSLEQVERLNSENDPYTKFMQYTGLKDKNDVEIYEGDIVKYKLTSKELIAKVEFNKIKLGIDFVDDVVKLSYAYNFRQISNVEVIGNIYENPDLLKG